MKSSASLLVAGVAVAVVGTAHSQPPASQPTTTHTYAAPPALNDVWSTGSVEQVGTDRARIEAMTDSIRAHPEWNVHAVLIEREHRLVYEEYFAGTDERRRVPLGVVSFTRDTKHDLRSVTKSVVSALVGIALSSGAIPSLDRPLLDYFPEFKELQTPERRLITIRHALMMAAGLEWNENVPYSDPRNDEGVMIRSPDPLRLVLSRPIVAPPGTSWRYSGGTAQVLGTIVQRATQQPLADYARAKLFSPLGIADFENGWGAMRVCPRQLLDCGCGRVTWPSSGRCI